MSTTEFTKATFTTLHGSEGMSTAAVISALSPHIGEPTEIEEDDGEIDYFSYAKKVEGSHWPSYTQVWEPVPWTDGRWALKFTLAHSREYDEDPLSLTMSTLQRIVNRAEMIAKNAGFEPGQTTLTAYSWYNGVDEPKATTFTPFELKIGGKGDATC